MLVEMPSQYQALIKRCTLLHGLTRDELKAFLALIQLESFTPGDAILTEGNVFQGIWLLLEGTCEVVKHGSHRDSRLAVLEPGAAFGEMSFLEEVPHSATVRAVDRVETMRLMREQFEELQQTCPSAALKITGNLVRVLSDRLRKMDVWACELVEKDGDHHRYQELKEFRSKLYGNIFE